MAIRNKREQKSRALHQLNAVEFVIEVPDPARNLIFQLIWQPSINEKKRNNETKKGRRRKKKVGSAKSGMDATYQVMK
jgi:hypothetical protein